VLVVGLRRSRAWLDVFGGSQAAFLAILERPG
jgi:hypothetical protein